MKLATVLLVTIFAAAILGIEARGGRFGVEGQLDESEKSQLADHFRVRRSAQADETDDAQEQTNQAEEEPEQPEKARKRRSTAEDPPEEAKAIAEEKLEHARYRRFVSKSELLEPRRQRRQAPMPMPPPPPPDVPMPPLQAN